MMNAFRFKYIRTETHETHRERDSALPKVTVKVFVSVFIRFLFSIYLFLFLCPHFCLVFCWWFNSYAKREIWKKNQTKPNKTTNYRWTCVNKRQFQLTDCLLQSVEFKTIAANKKKGHFFFIQIISKVKNRKIQFKFSMPKKSQAASLIWSFTNVDRGVVSFAHKC